MINKTYLTCGAAAFALAVFMNPGAEAQVLNDLNKAIENTGKGLKKTGEFIEDGVKKTGKAIEKGVKKTGDAISGDSDDTAANAEADGGQVADGAVPTPQQKPVQKSYLFVQQAGSLKFADGKLTLGELSPSTFFFTDRPERKAGIMSHEAFAELWSDGSANGFKTDPPNAAIAIEGQDSSDPIVVELLSASLSGASLTYSVRTVSGEIPPDARDIALFVDLD